MVMRSITRNTAPISKDLHLIICGRSSIGAAPAAVAAVVVAASSAVAVVVAAAGPC